MSRDDLPRIVVIAVPEKTTVVAVQVQAYASKIRLAAAAVPRATQSLAGGTTKRTRNQPVEDSNVTRSAAYCPVVPFPPSMVYEHVPSQRSSPGE